jgi:Transglycosylase-like domain
MWGRLRLLAAALAAVIAVVAGTILALTALFNGEPGGSVSAHRLAYDQGTMQSSHAIDAAKAAKNPAAKLPGSVSRSTLDSIAACESGGDPKAVSSDGTYRGKYQFDSGTWASVGGKGDPAAAPEAEQDMRAAMLYRRTGPSAWPVCG